MYKTASARTDLDSTIKLLEVTSIMLKNFVIDHRSLRDLDDTRLKENNDCLNFFKEWYNTPGRNRQNFITRECYVDIISMLVGFQSLCRIKLEQHPLSYVTPFRVNTDPVENLFGSQRGINGANNNPTALMYSKGINTIQISRKLVRLKSNAGGLTATGGALPYNAHVNKSFRSLRV